YNITVLGIFNSDEYRLRLRILSGWLQILIVTTKKAKKLEIVDPTNCESIIFIGASNAAGDYIPTYYIFKVY
ncbi:hypothetical protein CONLIGDRAFT_562288, partial [Coniochaeta ligniaria NRRL 30616]